MFGIPFLTAGLLIRLAAVLAIAAVCWYVYEKVEHWCNKACQGQTERADSLQTKWDAAVKRATDITMLWNKAVNNAEEAARIRKGVTDATFSDLTNRAGHLAGGSGVRMGSGLVGVLNDASRAANGPTTSGVDQKGTDPVSAAPVAEEEYDPGELATFFVATAKAYADAKGQWLACVERYQAIATNQGATQ